MYLQNLPRMLGKRRRLIFLFFIILIIIYCFIQLQKLLPNINNQQPRLGDERLNEYKRLIDDSNLDTSSYNEEFQQYNDIRSVYKLKQDEFNEQFKIIHKNGRSISELNKKKYVIYEYTKVFNVDKYCHSYSQRDLYVNECNYKNCEFTCDKEKLETADVLMFHESDLKIDLENGKRSKEIRKELFEKRQRDYNQIWLLWNDEANRVSSVTNEIKFNWTFSYRLDAEVSDCAYGCKYKRQQQQLTTGTHEEMFVSELRRNFNQRQNSSVWFVSNCKSYYRINFALQLSQHFPVNIQGACKSSISLMKRHSLAPESTFGKIIYPIYNFLFNDNSCSRGSECEINLLTGSKFYLSFESKNCSHYITEKFWSILQLGLIPVVIQPAKRFYEQIAPDTSFIHAEDFDYDPKRLSTYLDLVASDFKLYSRYLLWKHDYNIAHSGKNCEQRRLCELCTRLNTETSSIYYDKVADWFNNDCKIN